MDYRTLSAIYTATASMPRLEETQIDLLTEASAFLYRFLLLLDTRRGDKFDISELQAEGYELEFVGLLMAVIQRFEVPSALVWQEGSNGQTIIYSGRSNDRAGASDQAL